MAQPLSQPSDLPTGQNNSSGNFSASIPIAQSSITRDIEIDPEDATEDAFDHEGTTAPLRRTLSTSYSMSGSYRRLRVIATRGSRAAVVPSTQRPDSTYLTQQEWDSVREDERSLLRDNQVIPPKHPKAKTAEFLSALARRKSNADEEANVEVAASSGDGNGNGTEITPLLGGGGDPTLPYGGEDKPENIDAKWEEAIQAGLIKTTWQREAKVLGRYSRSLILTFLLQYSLTMTSVFTVGHLGKIELGAVSLGSMTANITGYAVMQGLATSLDTLCSQAYGSGHKKLVGLQMQRMVFFLWVCCIPIAAIWLLGTHILYVIVPEKETAEMAGLYLKIIVVGLPSYGAFESGKRFVQAQGLFTATLYVLLFIAPLNAFLHWLYVWHLGWGFIGAPIAVATTEFLLPIVLFAYVYFVAGRECWGGFSRAAFRNWGPMVRLALPGLLMVMAEMLAFEILTLSASWISSSHLAAQSVLSTLCALTFQIPFPMSVAASTRVANLIGATLADGAKLASKVALIAAIFVGIFNVVLLNGLRFSIPQLFTNDREVIELVAKTLPLCAAFQLFDAFTANCNGILRGIGRQEFGGYVNLICYYVIAMPLSFGLCFGLDLGLYGLWTGPAVALALVGAIEGYFIYNANWQAAVDKAQERNTAG